MSLNKRLVALFSFNVGLNVLFEVVLSGDEIHDASSFVKFLFSSVISNLVVVLFFVGLFSFWKKGKITHYAEKILKILIVFNIISALILFLLK